MPPAPPPDTPPLKYLFPFRQRPNLLDRDRIVVPSGWDSWGKIGVVREGFDCNRWSEAWENDLENDGGNGGAKALYRAMVEAEDIDEVLHLFNLPTCKRLTGNRSTGCGASCTYHNRTRANFPRKALRNALQRSRARSPSNFPPARESWRTLHGRCCWTNGFIQFQSANRRGQCLSHIKVNSIPQLV